MIDELVTGLVEREQAVLRELVRLAELNTAQVLAEPAFHAASMSIRAQLRAHAAKVEELELHASEQDRAADVEQAMRHVSRHRNEGATLQASLRDLGGKVRTGRAQQEAAERSALLLGTPSPADGGTGGGGLHQRKLSDRAATQAARDVTTSLRRTRQLMTSELQVVVVHQYQYQCQCQCQCPCQYRYQYQDQCRCLYHYQCQEEEQQQQ